MRLQATFFTSANAILQNTFFVASKMQQRLGRLTVRKLIEANDILSDLKRSGAVMRYKAPRSTRSIRLVFFSDASHSGTDEVYGQSGFLSGLLIEQEDNSTTLYSCVAWSSHKQKKVSYSSYGAEILAAAE